MVFQDFGQVIRLGRKICGSRKRARPFAPFSIILIFMVAEVKVFLPLHSS